MKNVSEAQRSTCCSFLIYTSSEHVIPSMTASALSSDTCSVLSRAASLFFRGRFFLCDQGSFSNQCVKPLWSHHPSIRPALQP